MTCINLSFSLDVVTSNSSTSSLDRSQLETILGVVKDLKRKR